MYERMIDSGIKPCIELKVRVMMSFGNLAAMFTGDYSHCCICRQCTSYCLVECPMRPLSMPSR